MTHHNQIKELTTWFLSFITELLYFRFFLTVVRFIQIFLLAFRLWSIWGLALFPWLCFQMDMRNYPHITIAEDGWLCSTGQHRLGFPRVLYDALHLRYNREVSLYRAHMSMSHSMEQCEVSMMIPINPEDPWMATVIGIELDNIVDQTAQVALASLCGSCLANTVMTPITLFLFCFRGDLVWHWHLEAVSDPEGPHYHAGMAALAEYAQYSFDLQHNIATTVLQQRLYMAAYEKGTFPLRVSSHS
jgi:hypothetical protein